MGDVALLLRAARAKNHIITVAESCTGGLVSAALTDIAGASDVFECGFITYSNAAKTELLGVKPQTLESFGAVSCEVAEEMAAGALARTRATLSVSITGIAGPGGSEYKPEGRVWFACAQKAGIIAREKVEFGPQGRAIVRALARDHALAMLMAAL